MTLVGDYVTLLPQLLLLLRASLLGAVSGRCCSTVQLFITASLGTPVEEKVKDHVNGGPIVSMFPTVALVACDPR